MPTAAQHDPEPSRTPFKQTVAWALYDFANTGYSMVGIALIFPRLYQSFWGTGLTPDAQTFWFGITVSAASIIVAILAPFLGALAGVTGRGKVYLLRFAALGILACASLYLVAEGNFLLASAIYILGTVAFYCGNIFFDALLPQVARPGKRHFVSALSFSFGYTAGFFILLATAWLTANPAALGLENTTHALRFLFVFAAVWWAVFTIPLALTLPSPPPTSSGVSFFAIAKSGLREAGATLKAIWQLPTVFWFLLAYLFYIDGVNTVIAVATNFASTLGIEQGAIFTAFFIVQLMGIPCALLFGWLGNRVGARRMLFLAIGIYFGVVSYAYQLSAAPVMIFGFEIREIYLLAALIGSVQGGIQALSRSYFVSIVPADKATAFFGFYSMIGKSAAVLGPALIALTAWLAADPEAPEKSTRLGMASLALLFAVGAVCLIKARPKA